MSKRLPKIGARVMRVYGRREYVDYGEVGTVGRDPKEQS